MCPSSDAQHWLVVTEGLEAVVAMVGPHTTVTNSTKRE
jgi:hypothetical protein